MRLRWGICAAGLRSSDFALVLSLMPREEHSAVAVAARSEERARTFADKHGITKAYGDYEAMADDADVDIVYIGTLNHAHLPVCKMFLNKGKNVLCERPLALNKAETQQLVSMAREKNVFFMEGFNSRFLPASVKLRELLASGTIGEVKSVTGSFGLPIMFMERIREKGYGGGGLLAIGVDLVQSALMIFNQDPLSWSTKGFLEGTGVDGTTVTTLLFPNDGVASLTCSAVAHLSNDMEIRGTKGHIKIHTPFWSPLKVEVTTFEQKSHDLFNLDLKTDVLEFPFHKTTEGFNYKYSPCLQYEAEEVRQCLIKGLKESPTASHTNSLLVARILQDARHDVGYVLNVDVEKVVTMPCQ